jgi:hypothetical protein
MFWVEKLKTMMTDMVTGLMNGKELVTSPEVKEADEKFATQRHSLLWEMFESAIGRWMPTWSKWLDLTSSVGIRKWDPEAVAWGKEFETVTAWTMFVPDRFLKYATDPILQIDWFKTFVENYPLGWSTKTELLEAMGSGEVVNPDLVVDFLRMVHQDMVTGVVGVKKVSSLVSQDEVQSPGSTVW